MNTAFVFIKPQANVGEKVEALVKEVFAAQGLAVLKEGNIAAEEIDQKKLIDQHYYSIASKATILTPAQLSVPSDKFESQFGLDWQSALAGGRVFNAMEACKELQIDAAQLNTLWGQAKTEGRLVKLGGGFYCGLVQAEGQAPCYVFNGFFMTMRAKFTEPGASISYYVVQWDPQTLSWSDFRGKVLGPTDPAQAPADSLRGMILARWRELGLPSEPNVGDNGVHASASPFEGLAERMNWLEAGLESDAFGAALLEAGVNQEVVRKWAVDPVVEMPDGAPPSSLFDALEDMDTPECIQKCVAIASASPAAPAGATADGTGMTPAQFVIHRGSVATLLKELLAASAEGKQLAKIKDMFEEAAADMADSAHDTGVTESESWVAPPPEPKPEPVQEAKEEETPYVYERPKGIEYVTAEASLPPGPLGCSFAEGVTPLTVTTVDKGSLLDEAGVIKRSELHKVNGQDSTGWDMAQLQTELVAIMKVADAKFNLSFQVPQS